MPSKSEVKVAINAASSPKTVTVTVTGALTRVSVAIDDVLVPLVPGQTWTGKRTLGPGTHKLIWEVLGPPETDYTISLSGDTRPWSASRKTLKSGPYKGADLGSKPFEVKT
ncbi:hypothetical protein [Archangium sp.]|uniref:hypothetical protein n=1 Tax=Archangium sp. TaxID=1872627 RepID=UPI00286B4BB4|nr:hypothetical protein [Archangium sp.]